MAKEDEAVSTDENARAAKTQQSLAAVARQATVGDGTLLIRLGCIAAVSPRFTLFTLSS